MERLGRHYLLSLYGCPFSSLNNEFFLCDLLENAAEAAGARVLQTIYEKKVTLAFILGQKKGKQQQIFLPVVNVNLKLDVI